MAIAMNSINKTPHLGNQGVPPTRALAQMAARVRHDALDAATRHRAKYHILDSIGVCLAGARQEVTGIVERAVAATGASGTIAVPGRAQRQDLMGAALVTGTAGHGLELDDGYREGSVHPGTVVIPALIAAAHQVDASGKRMIEAVVAGYEVMCVLAQTVHPRSRLRGFHNTAITGVFGAATVWGVLKGFDAALFERAYGIAASTASGLFAVVHGGDVKRLHPGLAAKNGLLAGVLAEQGLASADGIFECGDGFFQAFGGGDVAPGRYDGITVRTAGQPYAINRCYIKPYAACRHIHAAVDAVLEVRASGVDVAQVKRIEIGVYRLAAAHDLKTWDSFTAAQMSIPFVVATALRFGAVDLEHFSPDRRADPITRELADRINVHIDPACERDYPTMRPAHVVLLTTDGGRHERRIDNPFGEPECPLDDAALTTKFRTLVDPVLGAQRGAMLAREIWALEQVEGARAFLEGLRG